ncbi:MAG: TolC family protein [Firmicutes bacterium]|nr:TolC family protein [Bacillota bacterium]
MKHRAARGRSRAAIVAAWLGAFLLALSVNGEALGQAPGPSVREQSPAPGVAGAGQEQYGAVDVVRQALIHHLGVRAARIQLALGQARAVEQRASLAPSLSVSGSPYVFGQEQAPALGDDLAGYLEPVLRACAVAGSVFDKALCDSLAGLAAGSGAGGQEVAGQGYQVTLSARASLWKSRLQKALASLADSEEAQAWDEFENALGTAIVQSLEAYYGILRAEAALRVAQAALAEAEALERHTQARVREGTATEADRLQAEAQRYGALADVLRADGEVRAARMALNQSLGLPLDTHLNVVETDIPAVWPDLQAALENVAERGDVRRARRDLERAQAAADLAREQAKPGVQLVGRYRWVDAELTLSVDRHGYIGGSVMTARQFVDGMAVGGESPSWMAGLEVTWPILDGGQRDAQLAQAKLQVEAAALQLEQREAAAQADVIAAYARLEAARESLQAALRGVEAAREGLAVAEALREAGMATEVDVLRATTALAKAEQARLEASYGFTLAQAAYLQAADVLVEEWLELAGFDAGELLTGVPWPSVSGSGGEPVSPKPGSDPDPNPVSP